MTSLPEIGNSLAAEKFLECQNPAAKEYIISLVVVENHQDNTVYVLQSHRLAWQPNHQEMYPWGTPPKSQISHALYAWQPSKTNSVVSDTPETFVLVWCL